ncbi:MAG: glycogen-binding domain-containing protein [bacterium]|nr:MAG: glycogen-binding domain-containing protein [bacterium]
MAAKRKRVEFKILAPQAEKVLLAGTFNQWSSSTDPMRRDSTGTWKKIKLLPHGRHEYKFIVDGMWTLDPGCPDTVPNQHGTQNNLIDLS